MITEKTFNTGTVSINYAEGPSSGKPLVMLPGVTTWWQTFLPVLPELLIRHHTYALDLRGHGRSGRTPGSYFISDDVSDVIAFLRAQVKEPAVVLGWSLGAMVATMVAAEEPDLVRAVVLEDPPLAEFSGKESLPPAEFLELCHSWRDVITMDASTNEKLSAIAAANPEEDDASVRSRLKQLSQCDPEVVTFIIEGKIFEQYDLKELLPKITCPVLLLQADLALGGALGDSDAELAVSLLPDCTHVHLQDVGHGIHGEQPVIFSRIVRNFLESL